MISAHDDAAPIRFPVLQWVLPITAARIPAEILAGITLAAIAIPEVMGYTKISGTPVITGLYTMLIPTAPCSAPHGTSWWVRIHRRRPSSRPVSWGSHPSAPSNTWRWPARWR